MVYILFLSFAANGIAQTFGDKTNRQIDSLNHILANKKNHDTTLISTRAALGEVKMIYSMTFWDSIVTDCQILIEKNPEKVVLDRLLTIQAAANSNLGVVSAGEGKLEKSLDYFEKVLGFYIQMGNIDEVAQQLGNIGELNKRLGNMTIALDYFYKSLKIYESLNNQIGVAAGLVKIGMIYSSQGDSKNAIAKYEESLKISLAINDKGGMAKTYGNLGMEYRKGGPNCEDYECRRESAKIALDYFFKSAELLEELGMKREVVSLLNGIGAVYDSYGDPYCVEAKEECLEEGRELAMEYALRALAVEEEINDVSGMTSTIINLGFASFNRNNFVEAETYGLKGMEMAQKLQNPQIIGNAAKLLTRIYERKKDGLKALEMYKLHIQMRDSLSNQSIKNTNVRQEIKYEYEKQKMIDDSEHFKVLVIEQEKKEKQKIITGAIAASFALVIVFLIFVFNRLRLTRKQKQVIEVQKDVVETAHAQLEEKNREIMDSITYAKRIQSAILPTSQKVKQYLKDSFIFYRPKDIVAGDFYWIEYLNGKTLFAAGDCTGHGVPGAMVSIVCNNGLNRSVREHLLTDPGEILDKTRRIVLEEFEKSEDDIKDGMDIALCSLDGYKLQFAGAHNPLWIIRNGELLEIKGDKQPIGQYPLTTPFTTHNVNLQKGDCIYLFSDGFVDQFGGAKRKKFKAIALKELLLSIQNETMDVQQLILEETFDAWKGSLEQIDDVCLMGIRI